MFGLCEAGVAFPNWADSATPRTCVAKAKADGGIVGTYIDYTSLHEIITWLAVCIHEMMTCSGGPSMSVVSHLVLWLAELKARTRGLRRLRTSRYASPNGQSDSHSVCQTHVHAVSSSSRLVLNIVCHCCCSNASRLPPRYATRHPESSPTLT